MLVSPRKTYDVVVAQLAPATVVEAMEYLPA